MIRISEKIIDNSVNVENYLDQNQFVLSQIIRTFFSEATSFSGAVGMTAGRLLGCLTKTESLRLLSRLFGNSPLKNTFYSYLSIGTACVIEGVSFPLATELAKSGQFRIGSWQENFHGFLTIALCKGLAKGVAVDSIMIRHGVQDVAMSMLDQQCEELGILEKQQISFCQRIFMAEVVSLRMETSAKFFGIFCSDVSISEAKQDLNNQNLEITFNQKITHYSVWKSIRDTIQIRTTPQLAPVEGFMVHPVENSAEVPINRPLILAMSQHNFPGKEGSRVRSINRPIQSSPLPEDWPQALSADWWNLIPNHGSRLYTGRKVETTQDHLQVAIHDVALKMFGGEKHVDLVIGLGSFFDQPGFGKAARELNPDKTVDLYVIGDIKKMMSSYSTLERFDCSLADWTLSHSVNTDGVFIKVDIPTVRGLLRFKITAIGRDHFMAENSHGPKIGFPQMRFKDVVQKNVLWECSEKVRKENDQRLNGVDFLDRVRKIRQRLAEVAYLKMGSGMISSLLPDWKHFFLNRFSKFFRSDFRWWQLLPLSRIRNFWSFRFTGAELALGFFDTFDFEFVRIHENIPFFKSAYKGLVQFEERAESSRKIMAETFRDFALSRAKEFTVNGEKITEENCYRLITEQNVYDLVFEARGLQGGAISRSIRYWSNSLSLFLGQLRTTYHYWFYKWPVDRKCSRTYLPTSQKKYVKRKFERAGLIPASVEMNYLQIENLAYRIYKSGELTADEYDLFRRWLARKPQMLFTENQELLRVFGALSVEAEPSAKSVVEKVFGAILKIPKLPPNLTKFIQEYPI